METKYQIGTAENRDFLKSIRGDLFRFGRLFPSPEGSSYYLGDDGTPWKSDLYHAVQATLIPYNEKIGVSIAKAMK